MNRVTPASQQAVLAAIVSQASLSDESSVPPELHSAGAVGVQARLSGYRFVLALKWQDHPPAGEYALHGSVRARIGGGSRVRARASANAMQRFMLALILAPGVWLALSGRWWAAALFIAAGGALTWLWARRSASRSKEEEVAVRYLAAQLESAVSAAETGPPAPAQ